MMNNPNNIKLPDGLTKNGFSESDKEDDQIDKNELEHIINFIELRFDKTKSINKKRSSYGLKHLVERNINTYVSNGELIASMIICDYKYKVDGINCYFNVTTNSVK
jgi:hypothetical protein